MRENELGVFIWMTQRKVVLLCLSDLISALLGCGAVCRLEDGLQPDVGIFDSKILKKIHVAEGQVHQVKKRPDRQCKLFVSFTSFSLWVCSPPENMMRNKNHVDDLSSGGI